MEFKEKLEMILEQRMATKTAVANQMGMPEATFRFKSVALKRWNVVEFDKLVKLLRLTDSEVDFLRSEG